MLCLPIAFLIGFSYYLTKRVKYNALWKGTFLRRILYAALGGLVFVLAVLVGTVISAMFLNGVE